MSFTRQKLWTAVIDVLPALALTVTTGKGSKYSTFRIPDQVAVVPTERCFSGTYGLKSMTSVQSGEEPFQKASYSSPVSWRSPGTSGSSASGIAVAATWTIKRNSEKCIAHAVSYNLLGKIKINIGIDIRIDTVQVSRKSG
jgi:hypothetical protein